MAGCSSPASERECSMSNMYPFHVPFHGMFSIEFDHIKIPCNEIFVLPEFSRLVFVSTVELFTVLAAALTVLSSSFADYARLEGKKTAS